MLIKKASVVTGALVFALIVITIGLWFLGAKLAFAILVGLVYIAGVAYGAALLMDWLTVEETKLDPLVVLGDDIDSPEVNMTADEIMEEFK